MRRALWTLVVAAVAALVVSASASAGIQDEDYAAFDARVTDTQGVVTDVTAFGHATGPNLLLAHRGDAEVDVPFRLVRSLEIGEIVDKTRRAPCRATLRTGKVVQLEIENSTLTRLMVGETEFGEFRIRLAKVRRLDVLRVEGEARP